MEPDPRRFLKQYGISLEDLNMDVNTRKGYLWIRSIQFADFKR